MQRAIVSACKCATTATRARARSHTHSFAARTNSIVRYTVCGRSVKQLPTMSSRAPAMIQWISFAFSILPLRFASDFQQFCAAADEGIQFCILSEWRMALPCAFHQNSFEWLAAYLLSAAKCKIECTLGIVCVDGSQRWNEIIHSESLDLINFPAFLINSCLIRIAWLRYRTKKRKLPNNLIFVF